MSAKASSHPAKEYPSPCDMGNLYRFIEPLILYRLQVRGKACGYELLSDIAAHALTDAAIDKGAMYRNLRWLEVNGNVQSRWENSPIGPPRRVYQLTQEGVAHLEEWNDVLEELSKSMLRFVRDSRKTLFAGEGKPARSARKPQRA